MPPPCLRAGLSGDADVLTLVTPLAAQPGLLSLSPCQGSTMEDFDLYDICADPKTLTHTFVTHSYMLYTNEAADVHVPCNSFCQ